MYQLNLGDVNLYASLESDAKILNNETSIPEWTETRYSETHLAPFVAYDNGEEKKENEQVTQEVVGHTKINSQNEPQQVQPQVQPQPQVQSVNQDKKDKKDTHVKPKRSVWGFIKFALIVILIALIVYFTIFRIGWGVTECSKRNYHDCAALLTPELSALALTSIAL